MTPRRIRWPDMPHRWYIATGAIAHITRTNIAGCTTLCGVKLRAGTQLTANAPAGRPICPACAAEPETHAVGVRA